MTQKSILITGCSSGIGYDAAKTLRDRGWRVFATCRQQADCTRLMDAGFESFALDYEDAASVTAAVSETLARTGGTLDALFNNGAYAIPGAVEDLPRAALTAIFDANLVGWFDLTNQLMPTFRAQGHGRIVNCSSVLGLIPMKWRGAYVATKFALEGLTDTLRLELRPTGIDVCLIEPGPITTKFRANARLQFERWIDWESSALSTLYRDALLKRLYDAADSKDRFELNPAAVTAKLIRALNAKHPKPRYFVTTPTYIANLIRRLLPTRLSDTILSRG